MLSADKEMEKMEQRPLYCDFGESCGEGTNLCQEVKDCGDGWSRETLQGVHISLCAFGKPVRESGTRAQPLALS